MTRKTISSVFGNYPNGTVMRVYIILIFEQANEHLVCVLIFGLFCGIFLLYTTMLTPQKATLAGKKCLL